jgi:catechol 2,3-dioxygenase-like lactoylglutathione lyase family enzyme
VEPPASSGPNLGRVLETCLYVRDVTRARDWYRRVLGLHESTFDPPKQVFFPLQGTMLLLFNADEKLQNGSGDVPRHGAHGAGHVAFEATREEIERWTAHLEAQDVEIETRRSWPEGGESIYFRDPDGNSLELATRDVWRTALSDGLPDRLSRDAGRS